LAALRASDVEAEAEPEAEAKAKVPEAVAFWWNQKWSRKRLQICHFRFHCFMVAIQILVDFCFFKLFLLDIV
jgi:hypothetical protein